MKKIVLTLIGAFSLLAATAQGKELIPEYYLMERLIIPMETTPTYISNDGSEEYKAIQVDNEVMKRLSTTENPFYVYDSDGKERLVRKGDYFVAPLRLSSIYVIEKDRFENGFRDESLPEKSLETEIENPENDIVNPEDVDYITSELNELQ